ncbi:MAG: T9SS type A sorting domain-containing protein, partial [Candidatus Marinimicrobia bacterium]|nr:T9SS type A sorting domain-containing protein [Candidatus Neomarinimicrobiota bacterium]
SGTIFRLDPNESQEFDRVYETKISLLVEDYLPGETVTYLLGAYNEFYSFTDPVTNEEYNIIGIESLLQGDNFPTWNSFYSGAIFALRDNSAQYELQEINGAIGFDDNPLVSVRCYVESPFENEDALYFGGFDPNGYTSTNNAWIYKRIWNILDIFGQESLSVIDYKIHNNFPNPFNPVTTLYYDLPEDVMVNITIYDMMGRIVSNLVSSQQNAGNKSIQWDATNNAGQPVSAGVYLYSIEAGEFRQTKKMVLLK